MTILYRLCDWLIDNGAADETHPFARVLHIVGWFIERYEDKFVPYEVGGDE